MNRFSLKRMPITPDPLQKTVDDMLGDREWLDSALIRMTRQDRLILTDLLGQMARLTDDPDWTDAMVDELKHIGMQTGQIVREAAESWATTDEEY